MADTLGRNALAAIDKVLAERPRPEPHDFSQANRCLCAWRDSLVGHWRVSGSAADGARVARLNAALSIMLGGQFPISEVPWQHIEHARNSLAELLSDGT